MSSTIDAIIAQGPRPVQADPNAIPNRIITLRQAMTGQQLQQEQLEAAKQENQQRAIQLDQTRALNSAYQAALTTDANGTPTIDRNALTQALAKAGHGEAIPGIMKSLNDYDLSNTNLLKAKDEVAKAETEHAGSLGASVRSANYDPGLFTTLMTDGVRNKHVPAQMIAPMIQQVQQAWQQDPTGAAARKLTQQFSDQMIAGSEKQRELDNAAKTADARLKTANVEGDKAQLSKDQAYLQRVGGAQSQDQLDQLRNTAKAAGVSDAGIAQIPGRYSPAAMDSLNQSNMTADQRVTTGQKGQEMAETAKRDQQTANYQNTETGLRTQQIGIDQQNANTNASRLNLENKRYGFDLSQASGDVKMALDGRMSPATIHAMIRSRPGFLSQLTNADPKFDEGKVEQRFDAIKDFGNTSASRMGGQSIALNTMVHHADLFMQAADQLQNGTFQPGNALYNAIATEFGQAPPTNAKLLAQFLVGETGKLVGEGTEGAQNKLLAALNTGSNSSAQLRGAANTLIGIAGGRAKPWLEKIQDAGADNVVHFIGQDAKQILSKYGYDPNTMKPTQQGGRPAAAAAPPLPGQLSKADVGKTYMNRAGKLITITDVNPQDGTQFKFNEAK